MIWWMHVLDKRQVEELSDRLGSLRLLLCRPKLRDEVEFFDRNIESTRLNTHKEKIVNYITRISKKKKKRMNFVGL